MKHQRKKAGRAGSAREAICAAATELFAEKGFAAASTREICQRAGITKPVLYYHFGNKEQLYQELILDAFNEYRKGLVRAARKGRRAEERLSEVFATIFAFTRRNPGLVRLIFRMMFASEKGSPAIDYVEVGDVECRVLVEIIEEGIRRGEMKGRPVEIAEALMAMHTLYAISFLLTGEPDLGRPLARRIVDLLVRGCGKNSTDR